MGIACRKKVDKWLFGVLRELYICGEEVLL
jgi:hypothetical protein